MASKNSLLKIVATDIAGIACLISAPFIGAIPGPGGIPLTLFGLGLLAINHEWARKWLHYAKKHSESIRDIAFPNVLWVKRGWDIVAILILLFGIWVSLYAEWWLLRGLSIGIMAGATTIFMLNRDRISLMDKKFRRNK